MERMNYENCNPIDEESVMNRGLIVQAFAVMIALGLVPSVFSAEGASGVGWGTAQLIETYNSGDVSNPQVSVDSAGNAIAVWEQSDGVRNNIWSNRYVVGTGWGIAQLIESDNTGSANNPQVSVDAAGDAIAVWAQWDGVRYNVWSSRYVVGTGWGTAQLIETDNIGAAYNPQISVDSAGNATAVWYQSDGARYNILSNRYVVGTGWGIAQLIESDNTGDATSPQVSVDAAGDAIAVWHQPDGVRWNVWSNRYVVGTGWGTAQLIETDNSGGAYYPQVSLDSAGNAIAVWYQSDGVRNNIWSNRHVVGTGWGTAQLIETDNLGDAYNPQVSLDSAGNAIAAWYQHDGVRNNIWSNRYVVGTGWGTAQLIETDNSGAAYNPQASLDSAGNAIAVWFQSDGTRYNIWSNRYVVGTGWGSVQLIETDNSRDAFASQVSVDRAGNAIAIWVQSDGYFVNTLSNRYVMPDTTPPSLSLTSPSQGSTTETPVATVSGITEPAVTLKINGLLVAVGSDGSFSCELALVEGSNTILANAADAGGNSVTISRTVTYLNIIPSLRDELNATQDDLDATKDELNSTQSDLEGMKSQNLLLMALFAVFAVLAVVMSVMYFSLRKKTAGMGSRNLEKGAPPPPQS